MNGLINDLTTELKTNPKVKDSAAVRIVLESINNSTVLGVPTDEILESALSNLDDLATAMVNEDLKEVVAQFRKLAEKPTKRLQNMAQEAGISLKLKALKESKLAADPMFIHTMASIDKLLLSVPEFRAIGVIYESLTKFSYDPNVATILTDLTDYVNKNRSKLEILNAIFEMRQTSSVIYSNAITILEESLLANEFSADTLKMKMRGSVEMPIVNKLVNTLSMVEAKQHGKFNIGLGDGDTKVNSIIAPFHKIDESSAIVLIENVFVKLSEEADPVSMTVEEAQKYPEFYSLCESFVNLNFAQKNNTITARGRNLEVAFAINEAGSLQLLLNKKTVDDLTKVDLTKLFLMEQMDIRPHLVKLFNNLDMIVNVEFAKKIINEKVDKDSIVVTIGDTQFVFEKLGHSRIIKKMQGLEFHNYVMENFHYDVSELYTIQLGEHETKVKQIDEEKSQIDKDLEKLEGSVKQLQEALKDSSLSAEYQVQLTDLKESIERNIVALKNHYISLDQSKKKA